jgi:uncharacterized protein YjeT (DUF2065 family)
MKITRRTALGLLAVLLGLGLFGTQMPGAWRDEAFRVTHLPWQTEGGPLRSLRQHGLPGPHAATALVCGPGGAQRRELQRGVEAPRWPRPELHQFPGGAGGG